MWKGLAQIAVGLTHARRGNAPGATALLRRGALAVADYNGILPAELDASAVVSSARSIADRIELTGLASVSDEDLRLALTPDSPTARCPIPGHDRGFWQSAAPLSHTARPATAIPARPPTGTAR